MEVTLIREFEADTTVSLAANGASIDAFGRTYTVSLAGGGPVPYPLTEEVEVIITSTEYASSLEARLAPVPAAI